MPAQNTLLHLVFLISTSITNVLSKFHPRVSPANLNTPSKGKRSVVVFAVLKIDKFNSVEKNCQYGCTGKSNIQSNIIKSQEVSS